MFDTQKCTYLKHTGWYLDHVGIRKTITTADMMNTFPAPFPAPATIPLLPAAIN